MRSLMLSLVLAGCATESAAVGAPVSAKRSAADYFALTPGTTWSYEVELLGARNQVQVKMVRQNADGYFEDSTGAAFLVDGYGVRDQKRYLLRNPVEVGTKWTNVVSVSSIESYQVLSAGEGCTTRAGSWSDCVIVESRNRVEEGKVLVNEITLAVGVGIVRLATILELDGKRIPQSHLELTALTKP
jgi:hypothetical protein